MFFKKEETKNNNFLTKVCALLIHAAKIDENYTDKEEEIIKRTLNELGIENENVSKTIEEAKKIEENSNQILDFTREVKGLPEQDKIKIIEKENETFFKYSPNKKFKKISTKKISNENPFKILKNLNLS